MTALIDNVSEQRLLMDLEPVVEVELNRHLSHAKEWFPHEYIPWNLGEDIKERSLEPFYEFSQLFISKFSRLNA